MDLQNEIDEENFCIFINHNVPSSKNGRPVYGNRLMTSPAVLKWKKLTDWEFIQKKKYFHKFRKSIGNMRPCYVELTFVKSQDRSFDYFGPAETIADAMTAHGWINDDNVYEIKFYFGDFTIDKQKPGVYIKLFKTKPDHSKL